MSHGCSDCSYKYLPNTSELQLGLDAYLGTLLPMPFIRKLAVKSRQEFTNFDLVLFVSKSSSHSTSKEQ